MMETRELSLTRDGLIRPQRLKELYAKETALMGFYGEDQYLSLIDDILSREVEKIKMLDKGERND